MFSYESKQGTWKTLLFSKKLWLLWIEFNCVKTRKPLQGGTLLLTTKSPKVPGTHLIDLKRMKGWTDPGVWVILLHYISQKLNEYKEEKELEEVPE